MPRVVAGLAGHRRRGWGFARTLVAVLLSAATTASAVSVVRLAEDPHRPSIDCDAPLPAESEVVRIDAPAGGWPESAVAVLVMEASPGRVVVRRGDQVRCGSPYDARVNDTRLRSGVGVVLPAMPDSREPIFVHAASSRLLGVDLSIRYGDPAAVQREDTLRFAIRIAGFAVLAAMLLSALLLFANVRDLTSLVFAATVAAYALWAGLRTGLAGWPRPWLESEALIGLALMALPPLGMAGVWSTCITYARATKLLPTLAVTHAIVPAAALLVVVAWIVWPEGREYVYPVRRGIAIAVLFGLLALMAWLWHRGERAAIAVLIAVLPPLLVIGPLYDGTLRAWRSEAVLLGGAWFAIAMTIALSQRIGGLRRQRDQLKALAERDALTGLPNRRALAEVLPRRIDEARAQGRPLSVVFVDLDRFKAVNDRHGHAVGDEVLIEAARRLIGRLRGGEVVARQGGEEFVLMLPGADGAGATGLAERLRALIADSSFETSAGALQMTASFGVATLRAGDASPEALVARADAAMYRAKQAGRNRVEVAPA